MTSEEIKLRRLSGQHLLKPAPTQTVVKDLCGIQAQFMGNAMHALKLRCSDFDETGFGKGLVKNWTLRGTVHVFSEEDLPLFIRSDHYRSNDWSSPSFWNQRDCWALTPQRQAYLSEVILAALGEGSKTREELKAVCRACGMTDAEEGSMFDPWGGGIRELCERGFLNYAVREQKTFCLAPLFAPIPGEAAILELARRYFMNFGPATIHDAMYFFHTAAAQVRKWLSALPVTAAECGGRTYFYIENGTPTGDIPGCLFLAGFDQLMLGYEKKESLFLPQEHLRSIFNLAGIVQPAVLVDGIAVGRWSQKNGKLKIVLFSSADKALISDTAARLWPDLKQLSFE
ncbi:MAG: AlkZ family DNA glycosylase [Oscillospiraceae bacterium]|nr:AlkZ family DNA glycosylase [Oscillospiraceae bacterium]